MQKNANKKQKAKKKEKEKIRTKFHSQGPSTMTNIFHET